MNILLIIISLLVIVSFVLIFVLFSMIRNVRIRSDTIYSLCKMLIVSGCSGGNPLSIAQVNSLLEKILRAEGFLPPDEDFTVPADRK